MGKGPSEIFHHQLHEDYVEGTLTCLKPETIKKKINTDFPLVLNIEPTNACNLKCIFCAREKSVERQGINHLPLDMYKGIIDEISEHKQLIMLNLHKDGEPMLHKELPEMIRYAKKKNAAKIVRFNTNGTLTGTNKGRAVLDAGVDDVTISIDAAFPETYYRLKRSHGFDELLRNIESFIEYRNRINASTNIRVKIIEFDQVPKEEIEAFHTRWQDIADQVQVTGIHNWSDAIKNIRTTDESSSTRYPCALLWYALAVNSNGLVSVCNVDWDYSGVVGDINEQALHTIWNNQKMKTIRRSHLNGDWPFIKVCEKCIVWVSVGDMADYLKTREEFV